MSEKTVCFIGHRTVVNAEQVRTKLFDILSTLISNGADTFLFGSRSDFDTLCWEVVTELQKEYPQLKRISYNAPHEAAFTSKEEREDFEKFFSQNLIMLHTFSHIRFRWHYNKHSASLLYNRKLPY